MKKRIRVKITSKVEKNDGAVAELISSNKTRVLRWAQVQKIKVAYLRVSYGGGFINDGEYPTYDKFKMALNAFTEKGLIDGDQNV